MDWILRFVIGGLATSLFAVLGDILKPKSFAGLLGAAPSIALATLVLTISHEGPGYAALEARSMVAGAAAFMIYAMTLTRLMMRHDLPTVPVSIGLLLLWLVIALGLVAGAAALLHS